MPTLETAASLLGRWRGLEDLYQALADDELVGDVEQRLSDEQNDIEAKILALPAGAERLAASSALAERHVAYWLEERGETFQVAVLQALLADLAAGVATGATPA